MNKNIILNSFVTMSLLIGGQALQAVPARFNTAGQGLLSFGKDAMVFGAAAVVVGSTAGYAIPYCNRQCKSAINEMDKVAQKTPGKAAIGYFTVGGMLGKLAMNNRVLIKPAINTTINLITSTKITSDDIKTLGKFLALFFYRSYLKRRTFA